MRSWKIWISSTKSKSITQCHPESLPYKERRMKGHILLAIWWSNYNNMQERMAVGPHPEATTTMTATTSEKTERQRLEVRRCQLPTLCILPMNGCKISYTNYSNFLLMNRGEKKTINIPVWEYVVTQQGLTILLRRSVNLSHCRRNAWWQ